MSSPHEIPNEQLRTEHLPLPEDGQMAWISFALTFDGYAEKGSREACAAFANAIRETWEKNGTLPDGLGDLRTALFYEQRRWRWSEEAPFTDKEWRYWKSLVNTIRHRLFHEDKRPTEEIPTTNPQLSDVCPAKTAAEEAEVEPGPTERTADLYSEIDAHGGSRHVWLRLTKKGDLILEGQDLSGAAPNLFGTSEYEWAWLLTPQQLGAFLKSLGIEASKSKDLLEAVANALQKLERTKIQKVFTEAGAAFWSRIGD